MTPSEPTPIALRLRSFIAPGLIFVIVLSVTVLLLKVSNILIAEDLEAATEAESKKVADILLAHLELRMTSLEQVANHFSHSPAPDPDQFRRYCSEVMRNTQGIMGIAMTDVRLRPIMIESEILDLARLQTLMAGAQVERNLAASVDKVMSTGQFAITDPMLFRDIGNGFAALFPYYREFDATVGPEEPEGYIVGLFLYDQITEQLPYAELRADFDVELLQVNTQGLAERINTAKYRRSGSTPEPFAVRFQQERRLGSQMWRVEVSPVGYVGWNPSYFQSGAILSMGLMLAILFSGMLYRQQIVAAKSRSEARVSRTRLASTSDRLAQVKEELDLILNNVDEGIILYDRNFNPLQANAVFKHAFCSGQNAGCLELSQLEHHRAMAPLFQNESHYWALLNNLRERPEELFTDEIELKHSEGEDAPRRYYQRRVTTVCRPDGSQQGYLVIYQDVTPARNVEKLKEDFLSSVTHDLRTPLASIKGFAETMTRDPDMNSETRNEFMNIIHDEASRLQTMIEDLLDLRRMEEGLADLSPATYNLRTLLEGVVRTSKAISESKEIKIELRWKGQGSHPLLGDVAKIERALRNIIANAVKYSPARSALTIEAIEREDRVEVEFTDEGPGIPPGDLQHVFEKFYRGSKHVRRTPGTGLGLAIVRHIIESHGGVVSAANAQPTGTTIKVVLPYEFNFTTGEAPAAPSEPELAEAQPHSPAELRAG